MEKTKLSLIIPTLNEAGNITQLVERVNRSLVFAGIEYEIIVVDDNSTDGTRAVTRNLSNSFPVRVFKKRGERGKAFSLLEGFLYAQHEIIAFIDADHQYPPEALPHMMNAIEAGYDVVVGNRVEQKTSLMRKLASRGFSLVFGKMLHGFDVDVQSGLKMFKKKILKEVSLAPTQWTFDLDFLLQARNAGYRIGMVDIIFDERKSGKSKIHFLQTSIEIGVNALKLKCKHRPPQHIPPAAADQMIGAGIAHRKKRFVTHTTLGFETSAIQPFTLWQKVFIFAVLSALIIGFYTRPIATAGAALAILSTLYFVDALFHLFLVSRSLKKVSALKFSRSELDDIPDDELPVYSILCPLYKESAVLPQFLRAIDHLYWPKSKLDVLLLFEENDLETIQAASAMQLPSYVRTIIVPHSLPKTKPKACNYGLAHARGDYLVIYDAEDIPDPYQLKKAFLGFQRVPSDVTCLQAKLNYYNPNQNLLTKLFTAEYSLWFDVTLTGLQSLNTYIPLGGTSNHFRLRDLRELEGWDPFNVTEDCDLGIRLFRKKHKTAVIDSVTLEEANSDLKNWIRQRSRWIKGYMQTYLVHMRQPFELIRAHGIHAFIFHLLVGGKIAFSLINPILWLSTIAYFTMYAVVGPTIKALYSPVVFYMASCSLIFGNFLFFYYYMIGLARRGQWRLVKYVFFVPLYWVATSVAAYMAVYQLLVKPHHWEKTNHGLHFQKNTVRKSLRLMGGRLAGVGVRFFSTSRKGSMGDAMSGGSILIAAMICANILNLGFSAFIGRALSFQALGIVNLVNTFWYITSIFAGALGRTTNHASAHISSVAGDEKNLAFFKSILMMALRFSLVVAMIWMVASPFLMKFLNVDSLFVLLLFTPVLSLGVVAHSYRGLLTGALKFKFVALITLTESTSKFLAGGTLVAVGLEELVYIAIPISVVCTALVAYGLAQRLYRFPVSPPGTRFPRSFYASALMTTAIPMVYMGLDVILVQHYLSAYDIGRYALLTVMGKIVFFLGVLPSTFTLSLISRASAKKENTTKIFQVIFWTTAVCVSAAFIALGPFGRYTVPLIFGEKAFSILPHVTPYLLAIVFFTLANAIGLYHLARRQHAIPAALFVVSLGVVMGIMKYHATLSDVMNTLLTVSMTGCGLVAVMHFFEKRFALITGNIFDFISLFRRLPQVRLQNFASRRILIFNWRDTKHVYAGGAEIYVHEIAKRWVEEGNHVTLFCGTDRKNLRNEIVEGVHVIRRGGFYTVYLWAFMYYVLRFRSSYDLIIDCHNGIPFFTPLYSRKPVYCLMHHVHQEVFRHSLSKFKASLASFLEGYAMRSVYRGVPFVTVSQSSMDEMQRIGLGVAGITIVHPGVAVPTLGNLQKSERPLILYLGRLKAYKSVHVLIRAFAIVRKQVPDARLVIAGSGDEERRLKQLMSEMGLSGSVKFTGWISEEEKVSLLEQAWMLVNPSYMEGWAITTIEANASGAPVIGSNVSGLRDSIRHQSTGFLVPYGDVQGFAERMLQLIWQPAVRVSMMQNAIAWSRRFSWDAASESLLSYVYRGYPRVQYQPYYVAVLVLLVTILLIAAPSFARMGQLLNVRSGQMREAVSVQAIERTGSIEGPNNFIESISVQKVLAKTRYDRRAYRYGSGGATGGLDE